MTTTFDETGIRERLQGLPRPVMPAELVAAIEERTLRRSAWWESAPFRRRWIPALACAAAALGALWLLKIQRDPVRPPVEMAAKPAPQPVVQHAFLPQDVPSIETEKGERRDHAKS